MQDREKKKASQNALKDKQAIVLFFRKAYDTRVYHIDVLTQV
jgi:hypothetical protein